MILVALLLSLSPGEPRAPGWIEGSSPTISFYSLAETIALDTIALDISDWLLLSLSSSSSLMPFTGNVLDFLSAITILAPRIASASTVNLLLSLPFLGC